MFDLAYLKSTVTGVGYVYAFCTEKHGNVKIGRSRDPSQRIRNISTQVGKPIENVYVSCLHEGYEKTECFLHQQFSKHRLIGEWFNASFDDVVKEIESLSLTPVNESRLRALKEEQKRNAESFADLFTSYLFEPGKVIYFAQSHGAILKSARDMAVIDSISDHEKELYRAYVMGKISSIDPHLMISALETMNCLIDNGEFDYSIDYQGEDFLRLIKCIEQFATMK